jgi:hypothetical protein
MIFDQFIATVRSVIDYRSHGIDDRSSPPVRRLSITVFSASSAMHI